MPDRPSTVPPEIDVTRPSAARVYDFYLGGMHNFAVDRQMARQAMTMWPELPEIMRQNRAFLRRAVRHCVAAGIRQFLDLGSGIPTVGNVHEVAQEVVPDTRVVYVDNDPVAVAHSRHILTGNPNTAVVMGDLRRPHRVLAAPEVTSLLDLTEPIAVMMVAVMHFVPDTEDPAGIVASYVAATAPGSRLVLSHATEDGQPPRTALTHQQLYQRTATPMTMRSQAEVTRLLGGLDLVEPGVVHLPLWHPDSPADVGPHPERIAGLAAVGRRTAPRLARSQAAP